MVEHCFAISGFLAKRYLLPYLIAVKLKRLEGPLNTPEIRWLATDTKNGLLSVAIKFLKFVST